MLKIKEGIDLKELEKFGFKFIYDENTGIPVEAYKKSGHLILDHFLHFKKKKKFIELSRGKKEFWELDDNLLWAFERYKAYDFDLDTLYDLIEAGFIEKV